MIRADHGEVSPVERGNLMHVEPFGDGHEARIDTTKAQVGVGVDQLRDPLPVGRGQGSTIRSRLAIER